MIFSARKGLGTVVIGATNHLLASSKRLFAFGGVSVRQQQPVRQGVAPWDTGWNNTVGLCAIMAEEHAEDVREWLQYYRRAHLLPAHTGTLACSIRLAGSMWKGQAVTGTPFDERVSRPHIFGHADLLALHDTHDTPTSMAGAQHPGDIRHVRTS